MSLRVMTVQHGKSDSTDVKLEIQDVIGQSGGIDALVAAMTADGCSAAVHSKCLSALHSLVHMHATNRSPPFPDKQTHKLSVLQTIPPWTPSMEDFSPLLQQALNECSNWSGGTARGA
jgi:hypothetical protein